MKKYMFCFLLFAATSLLCLGIGFVITKDSVQPEEAIPGATLETETVTEDQIVINQEKVSPAPEKEKEKRQQPWGLPCVRQEPGKKCLSCSL